MAAIRELDAALRATEDWIDDLMRRLAWHDASASISRCSRLCTHCETPSGETRRSILEHACRPFCAVFIMKAGIPADMPALRAGTHSSRVFMTVSIASSGWIPSTSPVRCLPNWRRVCRRRNSRMQKPLPRVTCTIYGPTKTDFTYQCVLRAASRATGKTKRTFLTHINACPAWCERFHQSLRKKFVGERAVQ